MKKPPFLAPLVTSAFLISAGAASAALTVNESFDYDADPLAGQNGGLGWSGAWGSASTNGSKNVTAGSLTSPTGDDAVGNKASLVGLSGGSSLIYRGLSSTINSGTVYLGFTFRRELDSIRTAALSLYSGIEGSEKVLIGIRGLDDKLTIGKIAYDDSNVSAIVGTTYQMVVRIDFNSDGNNDALNLFINQGTEGTADSTVTSMDIGSIDAIRLFAGGGASAQAEASFDEIRIGSTYADVVAVPEPSSTFLIALTGIAALGHRRRN